MGLGVSWPRGGYREQQIGLKRCMREGQFFGTSNVRLGVSCARDGSRDWGDRG